MARILKSVLRAQGRLRKLTPVAIVDIGSNSVRLVIYEGLSRSPTPLFNEKILCGLGREIASTGRLNEEAVKRTLVGLRRFRLLAQQAGASEIYTLATAAAREASNGAHFIKEAEKALGAPVHVLTGEEEALYAAYGITCGFYKPKGVSADMGGGSVEFSSIHDDPKGKGMTLPLGGLRLHDESGGGIKQARELVKKALHKNTILQEAQGQTFYAVGGTWRALGRLHMARQDYPLHIMHNYEISCDEAVKICKRLLKNTASKMRGIESVPANRRALLPYGAALLLEIIAQMKPDKIVFSIYGVREGYLYALLPDKVKKADPLIVAAEEMAVLCARSPVHCRELIKWTTKAFKVLGMQETHEEKRYRKAACLLADITWRSHADYRADQALNLISNANFAGVTHRGRAYLALASYYRHQGLVDDAVGPAITRVATKRIAERTKLLGALFRVAYQFSAAMSGILPDISFESVGEGKVALIVPKQYAQIEGERLNRRIAGLENLTKTKIIWTVRS